jgi:hypothetical protein
MPIPGTVYIASRSYEPWGANFPAGVKRRLNDLKKALDYYGSIENWVENIDTINNYEWSYREYRDLNGPKKYGGENARSISIGIDLKIISVFDSTALAKIQSQDLIWLNLEVGDEVGLK